MFPYWVLILFAFFVILYSVQIFYSLPSSQRGGANKLKGLFKGVSSNMLLGLLSVFVGLWLLFYIIPSLFISLFFTLLGNIIIVLSVLLVAMKNMKLAVLLFIGLFLIYRFSHMINRQFEGLTHVEGLTPMGARAARQRRNENGEVVEEDTTTEGFDVNKGFTPMGARAVKQRRNENGEVVEDDTTVEGFKRSVNKHAGPNY
jgi:hypothetical protein